MTEVNELVRYQRELKEEEVLIVSMLSKIDKQLHALQVEQLQLLNASKSQKQMSSARQNSAATPSSDTVNADTKKELDLDVRHAWQGSEDEDEDESD